MESLIKELFEMQDLGYRDFHAKIVPNLDKERIIGVRSPMMKAFAKKFAKDERKEQFLKELPHFYYEENGLHGALLCNISKDIDVVLKYVDEFLPYVDNWATCDSLSPKIYRKHPEKVYDKVKQWIASDRTYTVRYGIVTALNLYLDEHFDKEMLDILANIHTDEYYINIAIAWYYSFALIKQYDATIGLIEQKTLDKWIHNKSIQKAVESFRVSDERKDYLRSLRIK